MSAAESRFYVCDRRIRGTAINPRYWVVDRMTNLPVDEFATKRAALDTARELNTKARER
jgi:hypothetical protein